MKMEDEAKKHEKKPSLLMTLVHIKREEGEEKKEKNIRSRFEALIYRLLHKSKFSVFLFHDFS